MIGPAWSENATAFTLLRYRHTPQGGYSRSAGGCGVDPGGPGLQFLQLLRPRRGMDLDTQKRAPGFPRAPN